MADMKTVDEIHEQQINELFKAVPEEERQRILSKFQHKKSNYLSNLKELQKEVNAYLRQQALANKNNKNTLTTNDLLQSLKSKKLTSEQLDFDTVMAQYIESEYGDEDHFWVTSDDPQVQKVLGDSSSITSSSSEELDEAMLERIAGGDAMEVERIKKRLEQEREESADQGYEFDNPILMTKQQALEIFTGRKRLSKQFEFVKSGLQATFERGLAQLTGAIGQEHLDEQFASKIDKKLVMQIVEQLKQFEDKRINDELPNVNDDDDDNDNKEEKSVNGGGVAQKVKKPKKQNKKKKTKLLFSASYEVIMLVNLQQAALVNIPPSTIPLKHPLYDTEDVNICVIVRDSQKESFKQLIASEPYAANTKVMTVKKLMTQYKPYDKREHLRKSYDLFYVEKEVNSMMPSLLGKSFYRKSRKGPQPMSLDNLKQYIQSDINGTRMHLPQGCDHYLIRVGKLDDTAQQVAENVMLALQHVPKQVPNGGSLNITKVLLKTFSSPSIPIYYNPDVKAKTVEELKQFVAEQAWRQAKESTKSSSTSAAAAPVAPVVETPKKAAPTPKKSSPVATVATTVTTPVSSKKRANPSSATKESATKKRKN